MGGGQIEDREKKDGDKLNFGQTVSKDTCSRGPGSLRGRVSILRTAPETPLYSLSPFLRMTTALEALEACVLMTQVCAPCIKSGKPEEQPCYLGKHC